MGLSRLLASVVTNYDSPDSLASRLRRRRIGPLLEIIAAVHARKGSVRILDLGGTRNYWNMFPKDVLVKHKVSITVVNLPGKIPVVDEPPFYFESGDGTDLSRFADDSFDIVHSNSVVEHVGDWAAMAMFAAEIRRLAPAYFVQTPYFWFPMEPHSLTLFIHWLPRPLRIALVKRFALGHWPRQPTTDAAARWLDSVRLLDWPMFRELFPDAQMRAERLLLTKSMIAVRTERVAPGRAPHERAKAEQENVA